MDPEKPSGIRLADGWTLDHPRDVSTTGSGACHSLGYIASNDKGNVGFVKVLDTRINRDLPDPLADLKLRIDVFQYERQILQRCINRGMNAVVRAIGFGTLDDANSSNPIYYLIFEMAKCDLREQVDLNR